jgi:hypothetical protein
LPNDLTYESGWSSTYWSWIGKFSNSHYSHFAKHTDGKAIQYSFNNLGYRGPPHHASPDISVFGSSFSFGVGVEFNQCWHQQLGDYRVNCYAPAGILVTNNNIIEHYNQSRISSGIVILQFREVRYNTSEICIPPGVLCFIVDECTHPGMFNLPWDSFVDKAEDNIHPGPLTHKSWAQKIKKTFNL